MSFPIRKLCFTIAAFSLLLTSGCNAPDPVAQNDESPPGSNLATQQQSLDSGGGSDGSGSGGEAQDPLRWTWTRPSECQVQDQLIEQGLDTEFQPSEDTFIPGCPTENIWHGELRVTHMWHTEFSRDNGSGWITVDAGEPAVVELLIYPAGDGTGEVISRPDVEYSHPVLLHGEQTFGDKECSQVGSGHYTIEVSGTCQNGWIILTQFDMIYHQDEPTMLYCDEDDPVEVTTFVPDGTPGLNLCFRVSHGRPHGHKLTYEHGEGKLETTMQLVVGDADLNDIIVPIPAE